MDDEAQAYVDDGNSTSLTTSERCGDDNEVASLVAAGKRMEKKSNGTL